MTPLGKPLVLGWNQRNRPGLSDVSPTAFFVPDLGPDWTIGLGSSLVIPAGDGPTDSGKLSVGPALLGYFHRGRWIVGARMRNIWSVAGDPQRDDVNRFIAQPLIRYQLNKNWSFTSSPIISSDWTHPDGDGWTVPVGGGLGYAFRLANQPMQISLESYYNAVKPTFAGEELLGDWTIRTQVQVYFRSELLNLWFFRLERLRVAIKVRLPNRRILCRQGGNQLVVFRSALSQPAT